MIPFFHQPKPLGRRPNQKIPNQRPSSLFFSNQPKQQGPFPQINNSPRTKSIILKPNPTQPSTIHHQQSPFGHFSLHLLLPHQSPFHQTLLTPPPPQPSSNPPPHPPMADPTPPPPLPAWIEESISGGSLKQVDLTTGTNGWASPPSHFFTLRSKSYFTKAKLKSPSPDPYLLLPLGVDWLKSTSPQSKLSHLLSRPDNRIISNFNRSPTLHPSKAFIFAVNLQVPGRDHYSAVFYFASTEPIPNDSVLGKFVNGDASYRNARFKIVNRIVKGPWIVKTAVGGYSACLLGKALKIDYHRGENYLELDVDIGSSAIASAILHLALGYVTSVVIDMGFVVEAQEEAELPERLIGAVRVCQMEMGSAALVDAAETTSSVAGVVSRRGGLGLAKVENHEDEEVEGVKVTVG